MGIKPYYEDESVTLYHGDCREVLLDLDTRFDSMITDPPYGIVNRFGKAVSQKGKGTRNLEFDWDSPDITSCVIEAISLCLRSVDPKGSVFSFCGGDQFGLVLSTIRAHGFVSKPAIWLKKCPPPAGKGNWWPSGFEFAVYGYRSGAFFGDTDTKRKNVFVYDSYRHGQPGKVAHPTQKPIGLINHLVTSLVREGGVFIDPFVGSGTGLVSAKLNGRKAVGIELEEKYCVIAADRLRRGDE